jgi:alkylation response protein AidB-like acyl-CoA dehydrogenase
MVSPPGARLGLDVCAELVLTTDCLSGHLPAETARTSTTSTIFEGTSEIQRMIIGRAVTGLDVR